MADRQGVDPSAATTEPRFHRDLLIGGYTSEDGRFHVRRYERRYNLSRLIVDRGWTLRDGSRVVGDFNTLREAKEAASRV